LSLGATIYTLTSVTRSEVILSCLDEFVPGGAVRRNVGVSAMILSSSTASGTSGRHACTRNLRQGRSGPASCLAAAGCVWAWITRLGPFSSGPEFLAGGMGFWARIDLSRHDC